MSTLKADTIVASNGTSPVTLTKVDTVKHWFHYDGANENTHGSFNQSSLLDNTTGDYTSNVTNNRAVARDICIAGFVWPTTDEGSSKTTGDTRGGTTLELTGDKTLNTSRVDVNTLYGATASSNGGLAEYDGAGCMTMGDLA